MINFSILKVIPFLVPHLFSMKIEEYQRKEWIKTSNLAVTKTFQYPLVVVCGKRFHSPTTSLDSKGGIQTVTN